jgi:hypothetical protein
MDIEFARLRWRRFAVDASGISGISFRQKAASALFELAFFKARLFVELKLPIQGG